MTDEKTIEDEVVEDLEKVEEIVDEEFADQDEDIVDNPKADIYSNLTDHKVELDGKVYKLTGKQELFCRLYATEREFFCNGVQSYIEAYDLDVGKKGTYNDAKANAYKMLTKGYILKRIDELIELHGLNDQMVDKQLEKVIAQDGDLKAKVQGIKEYNNLKARITKQVDIKSGGKSIGGFNFVKPNDKDNNADNNTDDQTGSSVGETA